MSSLPIVWLPTVVLLGHVLVTMLLALAYFRRVHMPRPPIGVFTTGDLVFMLAMILLVPWLYLHLPRIGVATVLGLAALGLLIVTVEPLVRRGWLAWIVALLAVAADLAASLLLHPSHVLAMGVNNVVLVLMAIGIANQWAQTGMRPRHIALLAGALTIYDAIATSWLGIMTDLFRHIAGLPFTPLLTWPVDHAGHWAGLGLGDLLVASTFPLVHYRAYGRSAGLLALALSFTAVAAVCIGNVLLGMTDTFPVMVVLGPLILLVHGAARHRPQRTTARYLEDEGPHGVVRLERAIGEA